MNTPLLFSSQGFTSTTPVLSLAPDLVNVARHPQSHLVQLGAVHLPRAVQVALRRVLELLHGQRDKTQKNISRPNQVLGNGDFL
jgi:hypothetical protein